MLSDSLDKQIQKNRGTNFNFKDGIVSVTPPYDSEEQLDVEKQTTVV